MKDYTIAVLDSVAEKLNRAHETLEQKGWYFRPEKMLELALFYACPVNAAVDDFCRYAENVSPQGETAAEAKSDLNQTKEKPEGTDGFADLDFFISEEDMPF